MHIITMCPLCNEDFMYHQTDVNLKRNITFVDEVGNNEVEETIICQDCDSKEKNKQETLEEAAERLAYDSTEENKGFPKIKAFKDGAKWQQERSYSEEEVYSIIRMCLGMKESGKTDIEIMEQFEQFKNK